MSLDLVRRHSSVDSADKTFAVKLVTHLPRFSVFIQSKQFCSPRAGNPRLTSKNRKKHFYQSKKATRSIEFMSSLFFHTHWSKMNFICTKIRPLIWLWNIKNNWILLLSLIKSLFLILFHHNHINWFTHSLYCAIVLD